MLIINKNSFKKATNKSKWLFNGIKTTKYTRNITFRLNNIIVYTKGFLN